MNGKVPVFAGWMVAVAVAWSWVADAATYTLVDGATDWSQPGSYAESGVNPADFTADDEIYLATNATAYIDVSTAGGIASLAVANSVKRLVPLSSASVLDITVPEGTAVLSVPFTYAHIQSTDAGIFNGELVKRGAGELELASSGLANSDYQTKMTVKAGTLTLPQAWPRAILYTASITVDAGATLVTARHSGDSDNASTIYKTLNGAGTITNRTPASANREYMLEAFSNGKTQCGTFTGKITGPILLFSSGHVNLHGTANDTTGEFRMEGRATGDNYETGVMRLANAGDASSIGAGCDIVVRGNGHILRYRGAGGDTSDRPFKVGASTRPFVLDAGATGGFTLTGAWHWYGLSTEKQVHAVRQIVLTGSNTQMCAIGGAMSDFVDQTTNVTAHFTKSGSGAWRFRHNPLNVRGGGLAVEAGTLFFDSLESAGYPSALGLSTCRAESDSTAVDYAFRLGGGTAKSGDADEPTLAYGGTNDVWCGDRPFAVKSDARLVNDTTNILRLANAYGLGTGKKTLTFGGAATGSNEFWNVSDGGGTLAVRKTGTGHWTLSGNLGFSGGIAVEGGSLTLRKVTDTQYTWYRWTLRESYGETYFHIENLSLFSDGKVCQTANFTEADDWRRIQPGQVAFARSDASLSRADNRNVTLAALFSTVNDYGFGYGIIPAGKNERVKTVADDTLTHIPLVLRLTNGTPEIVAFDYVNVWGSNQPGASPRCVKAYTLEGSLNGFVWEKLYATNEAPIAASSRYWSTKNSAWLTSTPPAYAIPARTPTAYAFPLDVGPVSVKGEGVLKAEGGSPTVSALALDATSGGVIDGFTFAANGALDVVNLPSDARVTLPVTLANAVGAANLANWEVRAGGTPKADRLAGVDAEGHVTVWRRGLSVILR